MTKISDFIWITWKTCRRTNELSRALGVSLCQISGDGPYLLRTAILSLKSVGLLWREKPPGVIVQNPSMALAVVACLLKPILRYKLVVDRHTALMCEPLTSRLPIHKMVHYLNRYTARRADLTIVTNSYLKVLVEQWGGHGFVLQDKLPKLRCVEARAARLVGKHNIAYICSFLPDEPADEVLEATRQLDDSTVVYVTGDYGRYLRRRRGAIPRNVVFTGFLSETDFVSLLATADAVMVLTKREHTLLCGAYEAVTLGKPLILSRTQCLREYFGDGPVYTSNISSDIARAIRLVIDAEARISRKVANLRQRLGEDWARRFGELSALLGQL